METKTVKIYGYEVTGTEEVVTDIENSFNRKDRSKDLIQDFSWEKLYENDVIFCWNGKTSYRVTIDHKNKKILAYDEIE